MASSKKPANSTGKKKAAKPAKSEVSFGYTLSSEEHGPRELVANAAAAEESGFDFVSVSDHYHPWVQAQGHSPFVWSVLGGIASVTESIKVGVGVTCPILRIHPAVIAQAAATTALMLEDRFYFGVGTGEDLNEHIIGERWPSIEERFEMLEEAVHVIRQLWTGETVDHRSQWYQVENARLFDPPDPAPPIVVSGFGDRAIELAGEIGDGYWGHSPEREAIDRYRKAGGKGPRFSQVNVCWAEDEAVARKTVHEVWPNGGIPGQLAQDLPTWTHFEQAAELVTEEIATESVACGPDVDAYVDSARKFIDAGYDHIYFHQIGPDQEGFLRFWREELGPALKG